MLWLWILAAWCFFLLWLDSMVENTTPNWVKWVKDVLVIVSLITVLGGVGWWLKTQFADAEKLLAKEVKGLSIQLVKVQTQLEDHIKYHRQQLFKEMNQNAPESEKKILIEDATLFFKNPEIFLDKHKGLTVVKQYSAQLKDLGTLVPVEFKPSQ